MQLRFDFNRWLDPQKLVRKQVRRSSSHSSSNTPTTVAVTPHQNGHGQKSTGGTNVIILYFRVKFYVTGKYINMFECVVN